MSQQYATDHPSDFESLAEPMEENAPPSQSAVGIVMAALLLMAVLGGLYLFNRNSAGDVPTDQAVAAAANKVADSSAKVGEVAGQAVTTSK